MCDFWRGFLAGFINAFSATSGCACRASALEEGGDYLTPYLNLSIIEFNKIYQQTAEKE